MTETPVLPVYMRRNGFDPARELADLRDGQGVALVDSPFGHPVWLVTRLADVRQVLGDATRFGNTDLPLLRMPGAPSFTEQEKAAMRAGNLLAFDPPDHTRLRKFLTPEFTVRRIRRLEPRIAEIVADHIDAMARTGPPADLVADFALPVPSLVICELLGVPYADRDEFQGHASRLLDVSAPIGERLATQRAARAYMAELVARAMAEPGDDLLGMLVREHGDDLSADELAGIGSLLLVAGHETTSNMLGLGTLALLEHPDQVRLLRAEPERIVDAVEELLRWLTVVHTGVARCATEDTELGGKAIAKGDLVVCSLPAANRDSAVLADPDAFDITRGNTGHVAFGHGVHHCIGAPLARMEMRIAFPALLNRFPALRAAGPEVDFRGHQIVYGLASFPVTW
ncbi:cytochrome P450 [Actinokineospora iranica]|uniref:Cytochrome P450 n=1 Tax=Actinokineospora iranica TaxID=1271860 RepID=A0A1G6NLW9_9PSEU|nr:cytochrome P450 [Actinokineospora iranica]SDC68185.1 Cytochrome P450 [Actinokineospora iranica]